MFNFISILSIVFQLSMVANLSLHSPLTNQTRLTTRFLIILCRQLNNSLMNQRW